MLLTLALSIGIVSVHIFSFMLAFRVEFAGDVNKKISFVATVLPNKIARVLLALIHWNPSCPLQLSIFSKLIHIKLNVFLKQWVCIERWT